MRDARDDRYIRVFDVAIVMLVMTRSAASRLRVVCVTLVDDSVAPDARAALDPRDDRYALCVGALASMLVP